MIKDQILLEEEINHFLMFRLEKESFAVNVNRVIEILEVSELTRIPLSPKYMRGVVNLRGSVLPVIDTHLKFEMEPIELTVDSCIIVMNITIEGEDMLIGALVDEVKEVLELTKNDIKPSPAIGTQYNPEYIEGMVKTDKDDFIMILNIGPVFSLEEKEIIDQSIEKNQEKKTKGTSGETIN